MGRMLDALKNLENDSATSMVTAPVVVKQPAQEHLPTANPAASAPAPSSVMPAAQAPQAAANRTSVGKDFLAALASSTQQSADSRANTAATLPPTSAISAAAATLAKLKAAVPPTQPASSSAPPAKPSAAVEQLGATLNWPAPASAPTPSVVAPASVAPVEAQRPALVASVVAPESLTPPVEEIPLPSQRTSATRLEETVKAALADPRRSVPLEQLARRMRTELRADSGRCWLLADAGQHHDSADLAAHLGAIFASQLGDVLLIDGNLDCALLSAGMNVIDRSGIAQAAVSGSKGWQSMIQPTAWQQLYLLPAGQMVSEMPDATAAWTELLSQAERRFRLVLVDGGPATEAVCKVFGRLCDATFVVVRLGLTEAREARQAMQQLRSGGARVIGSIATSVPAL